MTPEVNQEIDNQEVEKRIAPITGLVPMLHVPDVERSVGLYKRLRFAVGNRVPKNDPMQWG
jgi:hypothetical protein